MRNLTWYWQRSRAMSLAEMLLHARKKFRQRVDAWRDRDWAAIKLAASDFPRLPPPEKAPPMLREALRRDGQEILAGHWRAFGHLEIKVDDPPKWQRDYLAGVDLFTRKSAFQLNHRQLPNGADIKLIWELSRWQQLVRLAQAAFVLRDEKAGEKCILWLEDWVKNNPPFQGWNWVSALEAGMRLIQFTWIDALLTRSAAEWGYEAELDTLRYEILAPHAWFAARHRSFGSSANNHLLGELAGLIVATARWPALAEWGASLSELQPLWEAEVLKQFAGDGGNREQALNYHLFSLEFCVLARAALKAAGLTCTAAVEQRLAAAAQFYGEVQVPADPWDYGDSDDAFVTPLFAKDHQVVGEWCAWLEAPAKSPAIQFWLGANAGELPPFPHSPLPPAGAEGRWRFFEESGMAVCRQGDWTLRWDLSPLGYLTTAAHGHLDALHLSIWRENVALVIDPGTGVYYPDEKVRGWLAGRKAHNSPSPEGYDYPQRRAPFLWGESHPAPQLVSVAPEVWEAQLALPGARLKRRLTALADRGGWMVEDGCETAEGKFSDFSVLWQFAPGARVQQLQEKKYRIQRQQAVMIIELSENWVVMNEAIGRDRENFLAGLVSPRFRQTVQAPFLFLTAGRDNAREKPCVFRTVFLASPGE